MSLFSELMILAVSLAGIICGIALAYIAPEEIAGGKKYFIILKKIIFILISLIAGYYFFKDGNNSLRIFVNFSLILFLLEFKNERWYFEVINYLFFIALFFLTAYFIMGISAMLIAVLIFLYGLPTGTLFRKIISKKT